MSVQRASIIMAHHNGSVLDNIDTQQVPDVEPLLALCGPDVEDDVPASLQHCYWTCWTISSQRTPDVGPGAALMLVWRRRRWADIDRHWLDVSRLMTYRYFYLII